MSEPTPRPWHYDSDGLPRLHNVSHYLKAGEVLIGQCNGANTDREANARFIVHAVNCHDDLVAACKKALARCETAYKLRIQLTGVRGGVLAEELESLAVALAKATAPY